MGDSRTKRKGANLRSFALFALNFLLFFSVAAETVEISVDLKLDNIDYIVGERIRAVVDVANSSRALSFRASVSSRTRGRNSRPSSVTTIR